MSASHRKNVDIDATGTIAELADILRGQCRGDGQARQLIARLPSLEPTRVSTPNAASFFRVGAVRGSKPRPLPCKSARDASDSAGQSFRRPPDLRERVSVSAHAGPCVSVCHTDLRRT